MADENDPRIARARTRLHKQASARGGEMLIDEQMQGTKREREASEHNVHRVKTPKMIESENTKEEKKR